MSGRKTRMVGALKLAGVSLSPGRRGSSVTAWQPKRYSEKVRLKLEPKIRRQEDVRSHVFWRAIGAVESVALDPQTSDSREVFGVSSEQSLLVL